MTPTALAMSGGFALLNMVVKHLLELYKLKTIEEQGREPTPEEMSAFFDELDARRNAAIAATQP